jgi:hypothetical protein
LAEDAVQHRIRVKRLQGLEMGTARVLARADVQLMLAGLIPLSQLTSTPPL